MKPLMAAAGGQCYVKQAAAQVCAVCKGRKKKCDKTLPSCRNCVRYVFFRSWLVQLAASWRRVLMRRYSSQEATQLCL